MYLRKTSRVIFNAEFIYNIIWFFNGDICCFYPSLVCKPLSHLIPYQFLVNFGFVELHFSSLECTLPMVLLSLLWHTHVYTVIEIEFL